MRLRSLVLALPAFSAPLAAQSATTNDAPRATLADFAWLTGAWTGKPASLDAVAEVTFQPARAGLMTGVMRLTQGSSVLVVELISLVETPNGLEMRFRHFSPSLDAYEPEFKQNMRHTTHAADRDAFGNAVAYSKALMSTQPRTSTFIRRGTDAFVAHNDFIGDDGKPSVIEVSYQRVR